MIDNMTTSSVLETAEPKELWYSSAVYTKEVASLIFKITKPKLFDFYLASNTRAACYWFL